MVLGTMSGASLGAGKAKPRSPTSPRGPLPPSGCVPLIPGADAAERDRLGAEPGGGDEGERQHCPDERVLPNRVADGRGKCSQRFRPSDPKSIQSDEHGASGSTPSRPTHIL